MHGNVGDLVIASVNANASGASQRPRVAATDQLGAWQAM